MEVCESNDRETSLATRLDPAIGETSTGIGLLMSELVRRSLRAGVAEIDDTLQNFAAEQVEAAVQGKMPELVEVAETTSRQVSESLVGEVAQKSERSAELLTQSLNTAVDRLERQLGDARHRTEETDRTLQEVREKARQSWKKIAAEIEKLAESHTAAQRELAELRERQGALEEAFARSEAEWNQCRQRLETELLQNRQVLEAELRQSRQGLEAELRLSRQGFDRVTSQLETVSTRLAELERPRGLSALFQRLRGKSTPTPPDSPQFADDPAKPGASDDPGGA